MEFTLNLESKTPPNIIVIGIGRVGLPIVNRIIETNISDVKYYAISTDSHDLEESLADNKIYLDVISKESIDDLEKDFTNTYIVFIIADLNEEIDAEIATLIANKARELDIPTIGFIPFPFNVEADNGAKYANDKIPGIMDALIILPNKKNYINNTCDMLFNESADKIIDATKTIVENVFPKKSLVCVDFSDMKRILRNSGYAMIGTGTSNGLDRAKEATNYAIEKLQVSSPSRVIILITSVDDIVIKEFDQIMETIFNKMGREVSFIVGYNTDTEMNGYIKVSIIAFGLPISDLKNSYSP